MSSPSHACEPGNPLIRVIIVDDKPHVRQELRSLLGLTDGLEVVGEAQNGQEAIQQAERLKPDVVIMDLEMPILDGLQATREIKRRDLAKRVVMLSIYSRPEDVFQARQAGVDEFVQKGNSYLTLIDAIMHGK